MGEVLMPEVNSSSPISIVTPGAEVGVRTIESLENTTSSVLVPLKLLGYFETSEVIHGTSLGEAVSSSLTHSSSVSRLKSLVIFSK